MDNKYILTPSGTFIGVDELYHWGVTGMKWGIRRYQNPDGSLTKAGRKRYTNSDGTLNEKGKKYYTKETERLKAEKATLTAQKRTSAKLSKLDKMRKENEELRDQIDPNKNDKTHTSTPNIQKQKQAIDMDDKELQDRVNRLRNEDAYRDLSKKLGYDGPKTELGAKIAELEEQKKYLELQRDIKNLTPEKVSRGKKLVSTILNKVVEPVVTSAGKQLLEKYLTTAGTEALKKQADKAKEASDKSAQRVKDKEAKKAAKEAAKAEKAKQKLQEEMDNYETYNKAYVDSITSDSGSYRRRYTNTSNVFEGVVEGSGTSSRKSTSSSWPFLNAPVSTTTRNTSSGKSYVSNYLNTPVNRLPSPNISGYLTAPKDDDD